MVSGQPVAARAPESDEERELLRQDIRDNDIVYGNVVSKDFDVTAVIAMIEPVYSALRSLRVAS